MSNPYARAARNAKVLALAEALRRLYARCTDPKPPISEFAAGFDRELRHRLAVIADVYPPSDATWDELVGHLGRCEGNGGFGLGSSAPEVDARAFGTTRGARQPSQPTPHHPNGA